MRAQAPRWNASEIAATPTATTSHPHILDTAHLSEVEPTEATYLWYPYIPAAQLTVLEGDPGLGKSWITCAITSALTTGEALPGSVSLPPHNVLIASAEDGIANTIVPRLRSLGTDMTHVYAVRQHFTLDHAGVSLLRDTMRSFSATIVFIDPIVAYLGSKIDMHRANEVRDVMRGLMDAAEETRCAVMIVRHLRKGGASKGKPIYAGIGSIDFTASARSVLSVDETDHMHIMRHIKSNGAAKGRPITYAFTNAEPDVWAGADGIVHTKTKQEGSSFSWGHFLDDDTKVERKIVATATRASEARDFLLQVLAAGPLGASEVERLAAEQGVSIAALRRVRAEVAQSTKGAGAGAAWSWSLREGAHA